jgi:hypothetical protein
MKHKITSVYKKAERFASVTKSAIMSGNMKRTEKCLLLAEQLLISGSNETKNAISNVYVFSVSSFMELYHFSISKMFPPSLKSEYLKQVYAPGI